MSTSIRYFDAAVCDYFKDIKIEDGVERRTPQIAFAIPSRQGFDIKLNNENSPILPIIVVTRTGLTDPAESNIIKTHVNRPLIFNLTKNTKFFEGVEVLYQIYNYSIDIMALTDEMFNSIHEQVLYRFKKRQYVPVKITVNNHEIIYNAYLYNVGFTDSTTYAQVPDNVNRILRSTITFSVYGMILNDEYANRSVLDIKTKNTAIDNNGNVIASTTDNLTP
jgi:hypothetical protein